MISKKKIKVGIGFATGRKNFQKVLQTYIYSWKESGLTGDAHIELNLLVAYDLKYSNTKSLHYTNIHRQLLELIDETYFLGSNAIKKEIQYLIENNILNEKEAQMLFGTGYAAKRNIILYTAIKNDLDYLVFLDDDEYPMAVTKNKAYAIWSGQHILRTHLENIGHADITNGPHCGYISPIPYIKFNDILPEDDFRLFIEAISNDVVKWESIRATMKNGGVSYADTNILISNTAQEVEEEKGVKFITGGNLCINLTDTQRVNPFYNPPGARGEDTFLGTTLHDRKVLRIPSYTFHDGFSTYNHLMDGVLPTKLNYIEADNEQIVERFYRACIGWVRYKPLLLYITQRESYEEKIDEMRKKLTSTIPQICAFFGKDEFSSILKELEHYHKNVKKHYNQFIKTQQCWKRICEFTEASKTK